MDLQTTYLERALATRLSSPCSPNELYGYLTALLFYSEYSSTMTLVDIEDLGELISHFGNWARKPGMSKLGKLSILMIMRIKRLNTPVIFKISSVLDHATSLMDSTVDCEDYMEHLVPSEN